MSGKKTYVDNAYNRSHGRVGMEHGSAVISSRGSSFSSVGLGLGGMERMSASLGPSIRQSASATDKVYVDNYKNRSMNRVGLPHGTAVEKKGQTVPTKEPPMKYDLAAAGGDDMKTATGKVYVDNYKNRSLNRVGLPHGTAVEGKGKAVPTKEPVMKSDLATARADDMKSSCVKTYVDNYRNRKLDRVGLPHGTAMEKKGQILLAKETCKRSDAVHSRNYEENLYQEKRVYKDTSFNRKHKRVGLPIGSKPVHNSDLVYVDSPVNRYLGRVGKQRGGDYAFSHRELANLRKWLLTASPDDVYQQQELELHQDLSEASAATLPQFCQDQIDSESMDEVDNCNHILETFNRESEVDKWMEISGTTDSPAIKQLEDGGRLEKLKAVAINFRDLMLGKKIGHGGFGTVYFATYKDQVVAVKILNQANLTKKRLEMFEKEVAHHSHLNHPNVVRFLGPCIERPNLAIVMEYMDCSLWEAIHINEDQFSVIDKQKILDDVSSGLDYLHTKHVVHGDLKTQNVLLIKLQESAAQEPFASVIAKLSDFGLSQIKADSETSQTQVQTQPLGATLRYAAPEIIRGESLTRSDDLFRCDIYSVGMLFMELIIEAIPFEDLSFAQLRHLVGDKGLKPEPPQELILDEPLEVLLQKCWSFDPKQRPTAKELMRMVHQMDSCLIRYNEE